MDDGLQPQAMLTGRCRQPLVFVAELDDHFLGAASCDRKRCREGEAVLGVGAERCSSRDPREWRALWRVVEDDPQIVDDQGFRSRVEEREREPQADLLSRTRRFVASRPRASPREREATKTTRS
jgi:hypothetical protein